MKFCSYLKENIALILAMICVIIAKLLLTDTCFFWDSVSLISVPANFLYETNFSSLFYPPEINLTLATLPQVYTAVVWSLFGRSLFVTHLAYLPFALMFVYQVYLLCKRFFSKQFLIFSFLFILFNATIAVQILLLTPDLFLLAFSVWCLNSLFAKKNVQIMCSLFLLATVSDRGMILSGILILYHFVLSISQGNFSWKATKTVFWIYLPTIFFVFFVLCIQKILSGYFLLNTNETSPWYEHWQIVGFYDFFRNIAVEIFRYVENGQGVIFLLFLFVLISSRNSVVYKKSLLLLYGIFVLVMAICTLPFRNPINARYFAFFMLVFSLFITDFFIKNLSPIVAKFVLVIMICALFASNFIVYPEKIARSWDSSFAHFPYYELREKVQSFFSSENIDYKDVGTSFPLLQSSKNIDLTSDESHFSSIDFDKNCYVLYTNIGNLDDETIDKIKKYPCIKIFQKNTVFMKVYKIR